MSISFDKACPECGAPTEPAGNDQRRCVECEWGQRSFELDQDTDQ
ncbi:tRNA(Ile2) C34 agmatinyltransferase TiaS [Salinibacter ruber]|nr:tRNA(Ile2) C34 agmatinyltransferase TiaS [Salinibacter ruber]